MFRGLRFGRGFWARGTWKTALVINLEGGPAGKYGPNISAIDLPSLVLADWEVPGSHGRTR